MAGRTTLVRRACVRVSKVVLGVTVIVAVCVAYSLLIEPHWLVVRNVAINSPATIRVIHVTDIHYDGDREYLGRVVDTINRTPADLVCFTGDLIEDCGVLRECLGILERVNKPMVGIAGNHDLWARAPTDPLRASFARTGGMWLSDTNVLMLNGALEIVACSGDPARLPQSRLSHSARRVLLTHYPGLVAGLQGQSFDLILAGHSHGGQVRIPLIGRFIMPFNVMPYDVGLFKTPAGPLYVNPGIGTFFMKARFLCRPEVTVLEL
jgi:predicted MPP superfamily phosphohydrolase